jgi:GT2 family glycosyltransferase
MSRRDGYKVFGMGANFAARRTMLESLGGFDEVLGGGSPLQSAQDFDLSYRAFRRDQTILLAPEVIVHHFGFRSNTDWPRTWRSYGIGIGGFYGKHLRLRDLYAARLFAGFLLRQTMRATKRTVLRRGGNLEWALLANTLAGLQLSFRYSINRRDMLYRSPLVPST